MTAPVYAEMLKAKTKHSSNNNITYRVPLHKSEVHILFDHVAFSVITKFEKLLMLLTKHICLFCCAEEDHDYDLFGHSWSYFGFNNWRIFRTVKTSMVSRVSLFIYCVVNAIVILILKNYIK
jgi:hypothetical protein